LSLEGKHKSNKIKIKIKVKTKTTKINGYTVGCLP
jgi:hypothetical protein